MLRKLRHSTSRVTHLPPLPLPQPEPNPSAPPPLLPFPFFLTTPQDEALRKLQRKLESLEGLLRQHPLARAADLQPRLEALLQKQVSWCCRSMSAGLT